MKYNLFLIGLAFLLFSGLSGQEAAKTMTGQVSFASSKNIYVRFASTNGISVHDTLYIASGEKLIPVMLVNDISSTSCLCSPISDVDLPVGHVIIAKPGIPETPEIIQKQPEEVVNVPQPVAGAVIAARKDSVSSAALGKVPLWKQQHIRGYLTAASYSVFSNSPASDIQNFRYTLSADALHIGNSGFSVRTYLSFRHRAGHFSEISKDLFNGLKIYNLSLNYDPDSTTHISAGRLINPRMANMWAFDGLQFEKSIRRFTVGVAGGSRPGYKDYGIDPSLLQYGGYVAYDVINNQSYSATSLAFMEQMKSGKTDRRFMYLQHSGSVVRNLNYFSSFEIDLFKVKDNKPSSDFNLTSLYLSVDYRLLNNFSLGASYDARKNPVYYETYKSFLDSLTSAEIRQGFRVYTRIRITKSFVAGVQSSLRFQKSDLHQTKNVSGYLIWSTLGKNNISVTLSGNYLNTSYINGTTAGLSISGGLMQGKIQAGAGYSYENYTLPETSQSIIQHIARVDLYLQATNKLSLSLNYEATIGSGITYNRVYAQIMRRF